jgi:carbonic anhydrase
VQRFEDLIQANTDYAARFPHAGLGPIPQRHLAVLTCMDCRIDVHQVLGLAPGEAHVLRNAGARATDDAIRSLIKSTIQLEVDRIAVVHHTDCGAAKIQLDDLRARVLERTGHEPSDVDFHLIGDERQSIVDDVERLCASPYLPPGTDVAGFLYDVRTGRLEPIISGAVGAAPVLADAV